MPYYGSVLIVDDDPFVLNSASLLLQKYGYAVLTAETPDRAIDIVQDNRIDVVVTDIKMPETSGIELLERIHILQQDMPVILMTAYADLDTAVDAVKKGAFDFIVKPYNPEQLIHAIEKALRYVQLIQVEKDYKQILEEFNREMETIIAERTMSVMALTLADRVRNPASAIGITCRRILDKEALSPSAREGMLNICNEAGKLEDTVKEFQALLKRRQHQFSFEDINDIVRSVVTIISREAANRGVELLVQLSEEPVKINVKRDLLRGAIFYIVRNALEATPQGGRVQISTAKAEEKVTLTITDTGLGIPKEELETIFNPFVTTKERKFGMGLAFVRQVITEHFGDIQVESEVGKGTIFRLIFPIRWTERIPTTERIG